MPRIRGAVARAARPISLPPSLAGLAGRSLRSSRRVEFFLLSLDQSLQWMEERQISRLPFFETGSIQAAGGEWLGPGDSGSWRPFFSSSSPRSMAFISFLALLGLGS